MSFEKDFLHGSLFSRDVLTENKFERAPLMHLSWKL